MCSHRFTRRRTSRSWALVLRPHNPHQQSQTHKRQNETSITTPRVIPMVGLQLGGAGSSHTRHGSAPGQGGRSPRRRSRWSAVSPSGVRSTGPTAR
jgi:hypothetical protein